MGLPYHKLLGGIATCWKNVLDSLFDHFSQLQGSLPFTKDAYICCVETIYNKRMIAEIQDKLAGSNNWLPHRVIEYRYRVFENCMVDIYTAKILSAEDITRLNLIGYNYIPMEVDQTTLEMLSNVASLIEHGFGDVDPRKAFHAIKRDIVSLVADSVLTHWWAFQGYTQPEPEDPADIGMGDAGSELFSSGFYHCGDLYGAEWLHEPRVALDLLPAYLSAVGGTGKTTLQQELMACDDPSAIWTVDTTSGSNLLQHSGMFGKRVGFASESGTTDACFRGLDVGMIKNTASRMACGGIRRPKNSPEGQNDLRNAVVPPLIFFFGNLPMWVADSATDRRMLVVLPNRQIFNTDNHISQVGVYMMKHRVRQMLASVAMYIVCIKFILTQQLPSSRVFPSRHIKEESDLFHMLWKQYVTRKARGGSTATSDGHPNAAPLDTQQSEFAGPMDDHIVRVPTIPSFKAHTMGYVQAMTEIVSLIKDYSAHTHSYPAAPDDSLPAWVRTNTVPTQHTTPTRPRVVPQSDGIHTYTM